MAYSDIEAEFGTEITDGSLYHAFAGNLLLRERLEIRATGFRYQIPSDCYVCYDLDLRGGVPKTDAIIVHWVPMKKAASSSNGGCQGCRLVGSSLSLALDTFKEIENRQSDRLLILMESRVDGGPIFMAWGGARGRHFNDITLRVEMYTSPSKLETFIM
jgi:hypothetical protein